MRACHECISLGSDRLATSSSYVLKKYLKLEKKNKEISGNIRWFFGMSIYRMKDPTLLEGALFESLGKTSKQYKLIIFHEKHLFPDL